MIERMKNLRSLGVVVTVLVAVVALGMFGGGQLWRGVYAEGRAGVPSADGSGLQPSTILTTGTGTGKMLPAVLSGSGAAGQVTFWTGTEALSGDSNLYWDNTNKRLGIGTATPTRLLHIVGNICLFERNVNSAGFIINRTGVAVANRWVFGVDEPAGFVIKTYPVDGGAAVEQLVISKDDPATGANESKVGIGTTSPTRKLDVQTDSGTAVYGQVTSGATDYGVYGKHNSSANYGYLGGSSYGAYGIQNASGNWGALGDSDFGVHGEASGNDYGTYGVNTGSQNYGYLGSTLYGVYGHNDNGNWGALGDIAQGVYGKNLTSGNFGYLGDGYYGAFGRHDAEANLGHLGSEDYGAYGEAAPDTISIEHYGVYGKHLGSQNYGYLASKDYGVYGNSESGHAGYFQGKVQINGSLATAYINVPATPYDVGANDSVIAVNTGGATTINLPDATGIGGRVYTIKRIGTGSVTVETYLTQKIDGADTYSLDVQYKYVTVVSTGSDWLIVGNGP